MSSTKWEHNSLLNTEELSQKHADASVWKNSENCYVASVYYTAKTEEDAKMLAQKLLREAKTHFSKKGS